MRFYSRPINHRVWRPWFAWHPVRWVQMVHVGGEIRPVNMWFWLETVQYRHSLTVDPDFVHCGRWTYRPKEWKGES